MPSERQQLRGGQLLLEVSNGIVRVYRDYAGKGPSSCKAYWAGPDVLLVVMGGGFSAAEHLLCAGGHRDVVREAWHKLQDILEGRLRALIADLTGREVVAFMNTLHHDPDYMAQIFILRPGSAGDGQPAEVDVAPSV